MASSQTPKALRIRKPKVESPSPLAADRPETPKRPGLLSRIFLGFWVLVNILAAIALIASSVAGNINPNSCGPAVLVSMTFPIMVTACTVLFVLDLIWWRRTAMIIGLAMIFCSGAIHDYCPLNFPHRALSEQEKAESFTLMTYNTMAFRVQEGVSFEVNPQISYILREEPDVVCIQEYFLMQMVPGTGITQAQVDSLYSRYPYVLVNSYFQILLSKFPAEVIPLDVKYRGEGAGDIAAWRLNIHDRVVNLFTVHLRSLYFENKDKAAYTKMFNIDSLEHINRSKLSTLRHSILGKIARAAKLRTEQVDDLNRFIGKYGGENVIVCGDFNEPVGSYSLHSLEQHSHLCQVYPQVGFGPMITYNADHFYVRIDHVLCRGLLKPIDLTRGRLRASDHYPLTTTFLLPPPEE